MNIILIVEGNFRSKTTHTWVKQSLSPRDRVAQSLSCSGFLFLRNVLNIALRPSVMLPTLITIVSSHSTCTVFCVKDIHGSDEYATGTVRDDGHAGGHVAAWLGCVDERNLERSRYGHASEFVAGLLGCCEDSLECPGPRPDSLPFKTSRRYSRCT